jgi:large subunit ribosomal protein L32
MGVPKKKTSKTRRDKRRSHDSLTYRSLSLCPQCHEPKLPHRVCPHCGQYKGKEILEVEEV